MTVNLKKYIPLIVVIGGAYLFFRAKNAITSMGDTANELGDLSCDCKPVRDRLGKPFVTNGQHLFKRRGPALVPASNAEVAAVNSLGDVGDLGFSIGKTFKKFKKLHATVAEKAFKAPHRKLLAKLPGGKKNVSRVNRLGKTVKPYAEIVGAGVATVYTGGAAAPALASAVAASGATAYGSNVARKRRHAQTKANRKAAAEQAAYNRGVAASNTSTAANADGQSREVFTYGEGDNFYDDSANEGEEYADDGANNGSAAQYGQDYEAAEEYDDAEPELVSVDEETADDAAGGW